MQKKLKSIASSATVTSFNIKKSSFSPVGSDPSWVSESASSSVVDLMIEIK